MSKYIYLTAGSSKTLTLDEDATVNIDASEIVGSITVTESNGKVTYIPLNKAPYKAQLGKWLGVTTILIKADSLSGRIGYEVENTINDSVATYATDAFGNVIGLKTSSGIIPITQTSLWGSLPTASSNLYAQYRVTDLNNALFYSDGAIWRPVNGQAVINKITTPVKITFPAITFVTLTQADNGSGKTRLASAGVHGLTTGASLAGVNIYITWSAGSAITGMFPILTISDTTHIDIDLAYSAGLGTAVVMVIGATNYANVITTTIPAGAMSTYGSLVHDFTIAHSANAGTRTMRTLLGTTSFHSQDNATTNIKSRFNAGVCNTGSASLQGQIAMEFGFGFGQTTPAYITGIVNTATSQNFILQVSNTVANEVSTIYNYQVVLAV